jgi:hypothetical protein
VTWYHLFLVATVVLWPWWPWYRTNVTVNHNHYKHHVAVTMAMQRIALAGGVELQLQPRPIATPSSIPAGAHHVCRLSLLNNGWGGECGVLWLIVGVGAGDGRCYALWMDISILPILTRVLVTLCESSLWRVMDNDSTETVRLCR